MNQQNNGELNILIDRLDKDNPQNIVHMSEPMLPEIYAFLQQRTMFLKILITFLKAFIQAGQ